MRSNNDNAAIAMLESVADMAAETVKRNLTVSVQKLAEEEFRKLSQCGHYGIVTVHQASAAFGRSWKWINSNLIEKYNVVGTMLNGVTYYKMEDLLRSREEFFR